MATEPHRAAHPRGTTFLALLACAAAAGACLAGCSGKTVGVGTVLSSGSPGAGAGAGVGTGAGASAPAYTTSTAPTATTAPTASTAARGGTIPGAAWIASSSIPLNASYHWSTPSSAAKLGRAPVLSAVQDCQIALSGAEKSELGAFPAAQAELKPTSGSAGGEDDWSAQETVLATDDTSSGDIQGIYGLYDKLVADLGKCAGTVPGAKLSGITGQGAAYAATITIPTSTGTTLTWHEYLAAPYGYLVELSVWVAPYAGDKPSAGWDGSPATTVLSALQSGPCSVTKLC